MESYLRKVSLPYIERRTAVSIRNVSGLVSLAQALLPVRGSGLSLIEEHQLKGVCVRLIKPHRQERLCYLEHC
jgi:hypothetical protein